jgi:hypothetical protein
VAGVALKNAENEKPLDGKLPWIYARYMKRLTLLTLAVMSPTFVFAQWALPRLEPEAGPAPAVLDGFEFTDYSAKLNRVSAKILRNTSAPLSRLTVLITYWKQGNPIGGQIREIAASGEAPLDTIALRLNSHTQRSDLIRFAVVAATAPGLHWRADASPNPRTAISSGRFEESYWRKLAPGETVKPMAGCEPSFQECTAKAESICGSRGVGGVSYNGSTCSGCFYCSGSVPPDCGGSN